MIIFRKSDRKTCFYKWPDNPNIYDWESSLGLTGLGICQSSSSLIWYDVELEDRPHSSQPQSYFQTPEVAYVDAQRNCAVALGERDVKTDVWNKESFNFLHLSDVSIVLSWLVRFECPPYRQGERDSAPGRPQETLLTCIWARWERRPGLWIIYCHQYHPGRVQPHLTRPGQENFVLSLKSSWYE